MTRKEFLQVCTTLGIGLPMMGAMSACNDNCDNSDFDGKVIIIGAGAGGLSAAYLLEQRGIDYEILEASAVYGGRMKINTEFADFPIPMGAEWQHTDQGIFDEIVNDESVTVDIETIGYSSLDIEAEWDNGTLNESPMQDTDRKFVNSTWYNFFETYIVPAVAAKINYTTVVQAIDYSGDQISITTSNGMYTADRVVISVPVKILQDGDINFKPELPNSKTKALNNLTVWEGFKAFFEFSEQFYHTATYFNISPPKDGQKMYYDVAFGQNTEQNILGLFSVGKPAAEFSAMTDEELKNFILSELDEIYDGQATPNYIKHISQNWQNEPYIRAAYVTDQESWLRVGKLDDPVDCKLYFAGCSYTDGSDWSSVHTAARSARVAIDDLTT